MSSVAEKLVKLATQYPLAGESENGFELHLPAEISQLSYDTVVAHVEFRRKCMNQGFDNLLELLRMSRETMVKAETIMTAEAEKKA